MFRWPIAVGFAVVTAGALHAQQSASARLDALLARVDGCNRSATFERSMAEGKPSATLPAVSRSQWEGDAACWRKLARDAAAITPVGLSEEERVTLEMLQWESRMQQDRGPHWWVDFSSITPYASPLGPVARGIASLPLTSAKDTAATLHLLRQVPGLIDDIRTGLEQRAARGIRLSRQAIPGSLSLVRTYAVAGRENPFAAQPAQLAALDSTTRAAYLRTTSAIVEQQIVPAVAKLVALLEGPYATLAPPGVGLSQYPGGDAYFRWLVRWHTTVNTTPAAVHAIGVREVARIEREMAAIRKEIGFTGTQAEFHAQLAKDPKLFATTPEEVGTRLMSYAKRLEPKLGDAFAIRPRATGDVRRLPPALEPAMTFGYYQVPTLTDSVGHYFYNGTKLNERSLLTAAPIIAHELWPGHHFQVNLTLENTSLPPYRKGYYTAYGEGWGDYASIVAGELGLYADPYDRYGRLAMDMFISCRLVVDTGMNALGWSRERAMQYMRDHVLESETQIRSESLRYSTDLPGQALAYKMGSNEFVRLRAVAQQQLGPRFDIRAFHTQVLSTGSVPMTVLGAKLDRWIAASR